MPLIPMAPICILAALFLFVANRFKGKILAKPVLANRRELDWINFLRLIKE
jgi:hypothetical protein